MGTSSFFCKMMKSATGCRSISTILSSLRLRSITMLALFAGVAAQPLAAQNLIMPLGNSITEGLRSSHGGGYRYYLHDLLTNAGESFNFVGSLQDGTGFPDIDHEGHSGFRAENLTVRAYLNANPADVVLLEIGTNDISNGESASQVRDDISAILDSIDAVNPAITTILSTIIPRSDNAALQAITQELNDLLPALVSAKVGAGQNVALVDPASQFLADPNWAVNLMGDALHPNDNGYGLLALAFFNGIQGLPDVVASFSDDFNSGTLSANWTANPAYEVQSGELVNTSALDAWDNHLAVPNVISNPNVLEFQYGTLSDAVGRAFTGAAVMLDNATTSASGYLVFRNFDRVRLFTLVNGVPGQEVISVNATRPEPLSGDVFRVEWISDSQGHKFYTYLNGQLDAAVTDPNKLRGNTPTQFAGVISNGNSNNAIDNFSSARAVDSTPPAAINDLTIISTTSASVEVRWSAPGDDGFTGQASSYDMRYSESPITDGNFSSATPVFGLNPPQPAGTTEYFTIGGLKNATTYYFALKTLDELGNISDLSNVPRATTITLNFASDGFNRPGPELGNKWVGDSRLQIIDSDEVQHTAIVDIWSTAVFKQNRNATDVTIKWGNAATNFGTNFSGILVMASDTTETPNGYFIQHSNLSNKARLWHIVNGQIGTLIQEGDAFGPNPQAGSEMKVIITSTPSIHYFDVYIDGQFDRTLEDPSKRENGTFSGIVMESTLGAQNAITRFAAGVQPGSPKAILLSSGNAQTGRVNSVLPELLKVAVIDSFDNPVPNVDVNFVAVQGEASFSMADNNIRIEAEAGIISAPLTVAPDAEAAGGSYLVYPSPQPEAGSAIYNFTVPESGTYYLWLRNLTANPGSNHSWTVIVDGGTEITYDVLQGQTVSAWTWDLLSERGNGTASVPESDPKTFEWTAGAHTIRLEGRNHQSRLDKLLITSDPNYVPTGKEEGGSRTNSGGIASTEVTLGTMVGPVIVEAQFGGLIPAVFTLAATPGFPGGFAQIFGNNQSGPSGQFLPQPLAVTVTDSFGNPVSGGRVSWVASSNNGQFDEYITTSDTNGIAAVKFAPGNLAAGNKVEAYAAFTNVVPAFDITTTSGIGANLAKVSGDNQSGQVGSALLNSLVTKVNDANGQGVAFFPIEFMTLQGGGRTTANNPVLNAGFETSANGLPTDWSLDGSPTLDEVQLSGDSPKEGASSLFVNSVRQGVGVLQTIQYEANQNYNLTFWAKVDSGIMHVSWRMNDASSMLASKTINVAAEATQGDWRFYSINATNGAAGDRQLIFRTLGNAEFYLDAVKIVPTTGSNGQVAVNWTLGDTAGVQRVQALATGATGPLPGSPLQFTANAATGAAAVLAKFSGDGQFATAGQPAGEPFVAKVQDTFGNGVSGIDVTFKVTQGGGQFSDGSTTIVAKSDQAGLVSAQLVLGPSAGANNQVQATAGGLSGSPATFTATAAIPTKLATVSGNEQVATAGTAALQPLVVLITDASNHPISGVVVDFAVTQGNGVILGAGTTVIRTNAEGKASAQFVLGTAPGAVNRVQTTASHNGQPLQGSPQEFVIRSAALKQFAIVDGNNQTGIAGDPLVKAFKVMVTDTLNHGVPKQEVIFTAVKGGGRFANSDSTITIKSDSSGIAGTTLVLGNLPGNNQVTAKTTNAVAGSPATFNATAHAGPPFVLKKVSGDSLSGVVNNLMPEPFVTRVTDKVNNPLAGVSVFFEVIAGSGTIDGATRDTVKTDNNGHAGVTLLLGNESGLFTNKVRARAFNGSLELQNSPTIFVASATPSKARMLTVTSGNNQSGLAGEPLRDPICVTVVDAQGNPIPAHPVHFRTATNADGYLAGGATDTTVATNAEGVACVAWVLGSAVAPDSQKVIASANDGIQDLQGSPLTFAALAAPGLPSNDESLIAAPTAIPADGQTKAGLTIEVKDKFGNPIPNATVKVSVTGTANTIVQPGATNSSGRTTATVTSTTAEIKHVTAVVNDIYQLDTGTTVRFTPLAASQMVLHSGNGQEGNLNTILAEPFCVKIGDRFNNGVAGVTVEFSLDGGDGRIIGPTTVQSDSNGLACVGYVLGSSLGENRVRATSSGLSNSPLIFVATALNNQAATLLTVSGNNQTGVVLENLDKPLVVQTLDSQNRPVQGTVVSFTITFGEGLVNNGQSANVATDERGEARVIWRLGPNAGLNVVRASATGLQGSPITFQANARTGRPANLIVTSGQNAAGFVNQQLLTPLTIKVVDVNNNGVDGVPVIFELLQGTGSLSDNILQTSNGGFASVTITFGAESGARVVRASSPAVNVPPVLFNVNAQPANAVAMQAIPRTNNQSGTAGLPLNFPLQTLVTDQYDNPIPNFSIDFVVTSGTGHFNGSPSTSVLTDAKGIAAALWTVGAGANEATAIGAGLNGSPVVFQATGVTDNNFPIFVDVPDQSVTEGDRIEFVLQASDADNDPLFYRARNLPSGAVFDSLGTRIFTWPTDLNSAGHYEVSFLVFDGRGGYDEELVSIEVANRNRAPVIVSRIPVGGAVPDTAIAGGTLTMRVNAEDPDGDPLSYRWFANGEFAGSITNTLEFSSEIKWSTVEVLVFDLFDTVRTSWVIKTPVALQSFSAQVTAGSAVSVEWQTAAELHNAGFNVLRSRSMTGHYEQLNQQLIAPRADGRYTFVDQAVEVNARYYYKLEDLDVNGNVTIHGPIMITINAPKVFELSQNYPNPFNPVTNISYQLPQEGLVKLVVFNMLGQQVAELVNEKQPAGIYTVKWNGRNYSGQQLPTGIYHYRLQAGDYVSVRKMVLAK